MGKLVSELIESLANQAGIDTQSEGYIKLIQDKRLSEVAVPDDVEKAIFNGILTKEAAKNDKDVAGHFKVRYMKSAEVAQKRALKDLGVSDEIISELEKEVDTIKRIEMSYPKIAEFYKSTATSDEGGTKYKSLLTTHNQTLEKLQQLETTWSEKEKTWNSTMESREIDWEVNNLLNGYTLTDTIPSEDARFLINKKIKESPYIIRKDNGKIGVFQKENPDLVALEKNKPLSLKDITDVYVAPYLKKADTTKTNGKQTVDAGQANVSGQRGEALSKNAEALEKLGLKR